MMSVLQPFKNPGSLAGLLRNRQNHHHLIQCYLLTWPHLVQPTVLVNTKSKQCFLPGSHHFVHPGTKINHHHQLELGLTQLGGRPIYVAQIHHVVIKLISTVFSIHKLGFNDSTFRWAT